MRFFSLEPATFNIFNHFIKRDTGVLEVGAHIGSIALYSAQLAKRVVSLEPSDIAFRILKKTVSRISKTPGQKDFAGVK